MSSNVDSRTLPVEVGGNTNVIGMAGGWMDGGVDSLRHLDSYAAQLKHL